MRLDAAVDRNKTFFKFLINVPSKFVGDPAIGDRFCLRTTFDRPSIGDAPNDGASKSLSMRIDSGDTNCGRRFHASGLSNEFSSIESHRFAGGKLGRCNGMDDGGSIGSACGRGDRAFDRALEGRIVVAVPELKADRA